MWGLKGSGEVSGLLSPSGESVTKDRQCEMTQKGHLQTGTKPGHSQGTTGSLLDWEDGGTGTGGSELLRLLEDGRTRLSLCAWITGCKRDSMENKARPDVQTT